MKIGSIEHRDTFCRHFMQTYTEFDPDTLPWPELDEAALTRLKSVPFWEEVFYTERRAGAIVAAFTETVTEVQNEKVLAFDIEADPNSIPPAALDEHVLVGGRFFDVLEGRYEIEKISDAHVRLHLTSRFRLSTGFNFYSGLWSKLIMSDIQKNILRIVKNRSEQAT